MSALAKWRRGSFHTVGWIQSELTVFEVESAFRQVWDVRRIRNHRRLDVMKEEQEQENNNEERRKYF